MTPQDSLVINQLLGRLTYFHVLFIEPAMGTRRNQQPQHTCCHHQPDPTEHDPMNTTDLAGTPWSVLIELGEALGASICHSGVADCCATCLVRHHAEHIIGCWIDTEAHTHGYAPTTSEQTAWATDISRRLATAFARQHGINVTTTCIGRPPSRSPIPCELPLVTELAALWTEPLGQTPVISWLNHCADINDVARELKTRKQPCSHNR